MHNIGFIGEIYRPRTIFLPPTVWVDLHVLLHSKLLKKLCSIRWCISVVHGHSRSSKLVPLKSLC